MAVLDFVTAVFPGLEELAGTQEISAEHGKTEHPGTRETLGRFWTDEKKCAWTRVVPRGLTT